MPMRGLLLILLLVVVAAVVFGFYKNPTGCRKLGTDVAADVTAIYTSDSATASSGAPPATENTVPTPVVTAKATAPQHFQTGFVAPPLPSAPVPTVTVAAPAGAVRAPSDKFIAYSSYDIGLSQARAENKPLVVEFTGPDWNEYSQELDGDVISKPEFQKFAAEHFIFVSIVCPKTVDPDNDRDLSLLMKKYAVSQVPTLLIIDGEERQRGRIAGYGAGNGASSVISRLSALLPRN
jgi:hypothetical protein